jgi:hypothetical protein
VAADSEEWVGVQELAGGRAVVAEVDLEEAGRGSAEVQEGPEPTRLENG